MTQNHYDLLRNIDLKLTGIAETLGVSTGDEKDYGDPVNRSSGPGSSTILLESADAEREGIFISNSSNSSIIGLAFGVANVSLVNGTTISVYIAPFSTQRIEVSTLVSKSIYAQNLDGGEVNVVYHLKGGTADSNGGGGGGGVR